MTSIFKLIGTYSDPLKDISEEFRTTISISYAIEYDRSKMVSADGTDIPKAANHRRELVTIPLEDIGTTYTSAHFEDDHFSYSVLIDLKKQLKITASTTRVLEESKGYVSHLTCS